MFVKSIMRSEFDDVDTCDICAQLNGIVRDADDPAWAGELGMPVHCNCRYTLVPLIEGIDPVLHPTPDADMPQLLQWLGSLQTTQGINAMRIPLTGRNRFVAQELTLEDIQDLLEPADLILRLFGIDFYQ